MYQVSEEYKELVYQEDVPHILNVYLGESLQKMNEDIILGLKITHNLLTSDEFAFGKTPAKMIELQLHKSNLPDNFNSIYIETGVNEETVPIGYFTLESIQEDEDTITIKAIDNMIKFEVNYDGSTLEYPCNLMTVLTDICNKVGVELGSTSFLNADKEVAVHDNTVSARTYLSYIAEQAGGFAFIGRDGKLYIKTIGEDVAELPIQYFQDFKWGEQFKVSRVRYEDGVQLFEAGDETNNTIYINQENMYIVDQEQIDNIHDTYKDFNCFSFEGNSIIDPALDIGDLLLIDGKYVIYQGDMDYVGKFKANISSKIQAKTKEETMARVPSQKAINRRVESRINQVEGFITEVISEVDEQNQKVLKVEKTVDELNSKVSEIAVLTKTLEGIGRITLDNTSNTEVQEFKITGDIKVNTLSDDETGTYGTVPMVDLAPLSNLAPMKPHKKSEALYFSDNTYLTDLTLVHIKSDNTIEKILLPEFILRTLNDVKDEFVIVNGKASLIQRIGIDDAGFKYELKEPIVEELEEIHLILTEGEDIFYLEGFNNAQYSVTYMVKNDLTESFATKVELKSEISQTKEEVNVGVNKKLENYSTTTQMNAAINVKAEEINSEVSKKVNEDELSTKISQDYQAVQIAWNKIDELIQFINGKIQILNQNKALLMDLDKTGQHFYDTSGNKIGDIGIATYENTPVIAFNLNVDETHNKGMAWGIEKNGVFYPIFYTIGTYYDEGGEYGGSFVVAGDLEVGDTLKGVMAELTMLKSYTIYADTITGLNNTPPMIRNYYNSSQYYDGYPMTGINTDRTYQCYGDGDNLWFYVDGDLITSFSDKRLKTDIKEIDETLINIIGELKIYQFKFLKNQNKTTIGIMAQDLVEIANKYNVDIEEYSIINKVKKNIDSEELYYSINYEQFLILRQLYNEKKIQEQQELIEQLQNEIKELKGEK